MSAITPQTFLSAYNRFHRFSSQQGALRLTLQRNQNQQAHDCLSLDKHYCLQCSVYLVTSDATYGPHLLSTTDLSNSALIRYFAAKGNNEELLHSLDLLALPQESTSDKIIRLATEYAANPSAQTVDVPTLFQSIRTALGIAETTTNVTDDTTEIPPEPQPQITPQPETNTTQPDDHSLEPTPIDPTPTVAITNCKFSFNIDIVYPEILNTSNLRPITDLWNKDEILEFFTAAHSRWYTHTPGTAPAPEIPAPITPPPIEQTSAPNPVCTRDHIPDTPASIINTMPVADVPFIWHPYAERLGMRNAVRLHRPDNCVYCGAITALRMALPADERQAARARDSNAGLLHQDVGWFQPNSFPPGPNRLV